MATALWDVQKPSNMDPMSKSYLAHPVTDLGRPVVQHKPLYKGEHTQTSLAKVFDDPGMRPKVMSREPVNKPQTSLITSDIYKATTQPVVYSRFTDPNDPRYNLAACEPAHRSSVSDSAAAASTDLSRDQVRNLLQNIVESATPVKATRDSNGVSVADIEGTKPKEGCMAREQPIGRSSLDTSDIAGAQSGWKPPFRSHVGINLRDVGMDVSDINNYLLPKNYKTLFKEQPQQMQQQMQESHQVQQIEMETKQAPVPIHLKLQGFQYTGLPVFQSPPSEAWSEQQTTPAQSQSELQARQLSYQQQAEIDRINAELKAARLAQHLDNDATAQHRVRLAQAQAQDTARHLANEAICQMDIGPVAVEAFWGACKTLDRQQCGRLTIAELTVALDKAGVKRSPQQMQALVSGLRDNSGLMPYRDLSKVFLIKSKQPHAEPLLFTGLSRGARPVSATPQRPTWSSSTRPNSAGPQHSRPVSASAAQIAERATTALAPPPPPQQQQQQQPEPLQRDTNAPFPDQQSQPILRQENQINMGAQDGQVKTENRDLRQMTAGGNGPSYFPFKAKPYWFGGSEDPTSLQSEAANWKAGDDKTHALTTYHVGEDIKAMAEPPQTQGIQQSYSFPKRSLETQKSSASMCSTHEEPTVSSKLKTGKMNSQELAQSLIIKHSAKSKPQYVSQQQQQYASSGSGGSIGTTLKGTLSPVGTGALQVGVTAHSRRASSATSVRNHVGRSSNTHIRPTSAMPTTPDRAAASFSAIAQSTGGPKMEKLHRQMLSSEIQSVRRLF